jgi:hypothetical protein
MISMNSARTHPFKNGSRSSCGCTGKTPDLIAFFDRQKTTARIDAMPAQRSPAGIIPDGRLFGSPGGAREDKGLRPRLLGRIADEKTEGPRTVSGRNCRQRPCSRRIRASKSPIIAKARKADFVSIPKMATFMSKRRIKVLLF